ncbi:MAG TPA: CBS domain-containing protein [Acidimicrobiia bacterium]|jgi:CBS domain-containing protein|nr:CBS domain-containing protein [Acidimicrobiia bacterium]
MPTTTPIRDVMTTKVITLSADQAFEDAADVLAKHSIGAAPVVDDDGHVLGLLRDEDLIVSESNIHAPTWFNLFGVGVELPGAQKHFEHELRRMVAATVQDLMSTQFETARPDDTLGSVAAKMHDRDVTHMPVVDDDGHLVGIVARGDLVRRVAAET